LRGKGNNNGTIVPINLKIFLQQQLGRQKALPLNKVLAKKGQTEVIELSEFYCKFVLRLGGRFSMPLLRQYSNVVSN